MNSCREKVSFAWNQAQDFARLMFNFLRCSHRYWLIGRNAKKLRKRKAWPEEDKAALDCYRRFGDVCGPFEPWAENHKRKFNLLEKPELEFQRGSEVGSLAANDFVLVIPQSYQVPSEDEWLKIRSKLKLQCQLQEAALATEKAVSNALKQVAIRASSLWKILNLVYLRAQFPEIEQWRVGAMAKLVKRFAHVLDPWEARSRKGGEEPRHHMNLMVRKCLDRGALIAENAAQNIFPSDAGAISKQLRFDFDDSDFRTRLLSPGLDEANFANLRALAC
jgi:hypothetical protein